MAKWIIKPWFVPIVAIAMLLAVSVACGGDDATEAPTSTTVPTATTAAPAGTDTPVPMATTASPTATAPPSATNTPVPTATPEAMKGGVVDMSFVMEGRVGGLSLPMYNYSYSSHWDMHAANALDSTRGARSMFNGLVHYSFQDPRIVICDLCESWTLADDGLTYTFNINPNANWSNGEPVTAEDVAFSLDRMVDPDAVRPRTSALKPYYESSKVIDEKTLELTTKFPAAAFLKFLALDYMVIHNKKHVESLDPESLDLFDGVLGSGAFVPVESLVGETWTLERNPNYWKEGLPFLDKVQVIVVRGRSNQLASMLADQTLGSLQSGGGVTVATQSEAVEQSGGKLRPTTAYVGPAAAWVNPLTPPFDDKRVRRAAFLLINREEMNQGVFKGGMSPGSFFGPGVAHSGEEIAQWEGYRNNPDGSKLQEDIDTAVALLRDAGYSENNRLKFTLTITNVGDNPLGATFLKQQFERSGLIEVEIEPVESGVGLARQTAGEFQMTYRRTAVSTDDPDGVFLPIYLPGGGENPHGYVDPRIQEIFDSQTREFDPATRRELLREADNILRQGEGHFLTIGNTSSFGVWNVKLRNMGLWEGQWGEYLRPIDMLAEMEHVWIDEDAPLYDPAAPYPNID